MMHYAINSKLAAVSGGALLSLAMGFSSTASAGSVVYADPVPAGPTYPKCLPDLGGTPTGADGGISYEWTVRMGKNDKVGFVNKVGAKSFNEPESSGYFQPDTGWTHTSNWVALELTHRTNVRIEVERQEGVPFANNGTTATARNMLVPAIAVYAGWDDTSCEDHRYNNAGNVDWTTIQFIGNAANEKGRPVAVYSANLKAGRYSVAIGGSPKVLASYPDGAKCDPLDPVCYAYNGNHGYRAVIKTSRD